MSLRRFLLIPLAVSVAIFLFFSDEVIDSYRIVTETVNLSMGLAFTIIAAISLQLIGQIIRAYKMRLLLSPVKSSTTRFQFRALSIGYLFNMLLPFRLGELIRAQVIAGGERISFGFALVLIVIERSIDALFLAIIGIALYAIGVIGTTSLEYAIILFFIGAAVLGSVAIIGSENVWLLRLWHKFSALFNPTIALQMRFKAWSIVYGLQRITSRKSALQYLGFTVVSWAFYIMSIVTIVQYFAPNISAGQKTALAVSPFYGISLPSGPASLGTFSDLVSTISSDVFVQTATHTSFILVSWAVLVVPMSILGVVFLIFKTKEPLWRSLPKKASQDSLSEKLSRTEDFSYELGHFLDNYFSGNSLSQIVHKLELEDDFRLIRYFKGGSDAITILALQNNDMVVKKIIPVEYTDRLRAQYQWLRSRSKTPGIVRALREYEKQNYYAIDLEYDEVNEMFFDYMQKNSLDSSKRVLDLVWDHLFKSIYSKTEIITDLEAVDAYIQKHIFGCMDVAIEVNKDLFAAIQPKKIKINGKAYKNLHQVMEKIMNNKRIMRDLATFAHSKEVHGDVAVDNILVSTKTNKPLIIDPAPDGNIINGPVFDFGKNMQSLYCGYEFLFRSDEIVNLSDDGSISYKDNKSVQFMQLCDYVRNELSPKYLSEGERRAMIFHAGALHIRRLKHQVYQNPGTALAIYAVGVKTLNEFLDLYSDL